jgi:hypothetical protein
MSAPPGYNETASMLPDGGGTIRAMHGGFSASPYSGGVTSMTSLLPEVGERNAPILSHHGGAPTGAADPPASVILPIAIAATSAAAAAPIVAPVARVAPPVASAAPDAAPVAPVAASVAAPVAASVAAPVAASVPAVDAPVAVSSSTSSSMIASSTSVPVTAADLKPSDDEMYGSDIGNAGNNAADMKNVDEEIETKPITIYGKEYIVGPPSICVKNWDKLMADIGLDVLSPDDQKEFKDMIYNKPACIEEDLLISSHIKCEPMRKFIFKLATKLLDIPNSSCSGNKHTIIFDPEKHVEKLSVRNISVLSEPKEGAPVKGGLRQKKRRTIRKKK